MMRWSSVRYVRGMQRGSFCFLLIALPLISLRATESSPQEPQPQQNPTLPPQKQEEVIRLEQKIQETPQIRLTGPDTTEQPNIGIKGNWVKKKDWLIKSFELLKQINTLAVEIQSTRSSFIERYNVIDSELNKFYMSIGLEQGKLQELFSGLQKYLDKKKEEKKANLEKQDLKERIYNLKLELLEEKITSYKDQLKQLQLDMKAIENLDKSIYDRLEKMDEKIKEAIELAQRAKKITDSLWNIIDHAIAEKEYYKLKGDILEKLSSIKNYLSNDLLRNFDSVTQTVRDQMTKSKNAIDELEKKGFIFINRSRRIEDIKLQELRDKELAEKAESEEKKEEKKPVNKPLSWRDYLTSLAAEIYNHIASFISSLISSTAQTKPGSTPTTTQTPTATPTPDHHAPQVSGSPQQPTHIESPSSIPAETK